MAKGNTLMTKRVQIILTISAVISFILAFTLDITSFGQNKNISWEHIEVVRFLIIISSITIVGLLLGLFLFRKRGFKKRALLTIPIAFILFSFVDIITVASNYYGLNEEYNYFSANRDIRNGKIQILNTGLILPEPNEDFVKKQNVEKELEKQFGYKSINLGCVDSHGIDVYNSVVENYLEKRNGKGWKVKRQHILDSLMNFSKSP